MKTFPDFTWEWIIQSCLHFCDIMQNEINNGPNDLHERYQGYLRTTQGIIAIVPKLREHKQLEKLVPMKSLMNLRWFPTKGYEISLYYNEEMNIYRISVIKNLPGLDIELKEEKLVEFDNVAEELFSYITRLSDGAKQDLG